MRKIIKCSRKDYPVLKDIWERSVRSTHDFLSETDFNAIRDALETLYFPYVALFAIKDNGKYCGFIGLSDSKIEMLFIDSDKLRRGYGSALLDFALYRGYSLVDVNEQNAAGIEFYKAKGFRAISRDETDEMGLPYPILHLMI